MRIGGRGRQSTRKDTDQTEELTAKKESAGTKKGRRTRKEPGGILLRKRRKECRGMIRIGTTSEPEGTLLKKRRSSRIAGRGLRSESNHSLMGRLGKILLTKRGRPVAREERRLTNSGLLALLQMLFS